MIRLIDRRLHERRAPSRAARGPLSGSTWRGLAKRLSFAAGTVDDNADIHYNQFARRGASTTRGVRASAAEIQSDEPREPTSEIPLKGIAFDPWTTPVWNLRPNNRDRLRVWVPFASLRILVDQPTPIICAVRPSRISNPLVVAPFNHEHFRAYCNTFRLLANVSSENNCSLFEEIQSLEPLIAGNRRTPVSLCKRTDTPEGSAAREPGKCPRR